MTPRRFVNALRRLGYTPHDAHLLLGISRSAVFKYAGGQAPVPAIVVKLLDMYARYGAPPKEEGGRDG